MSSRRGRRRSRFTQTRRQNDVRAAFAALTRAHNYRVYRVCLTLPETHLPNALDLLAFVP
jgi:hypothetical protein